MFCFPFLKVYFFSPPIFNENALANNWLFFKVKFFGSYINIL